MMSHQGHGDPRLVVTIKELEASGAQSLIPQMVQPRATMVIKWPSGSKFSLDCEAISTH